MIPDLPITLLVGALVGLFGLFYLARPAEDQERLRRPILIACAVAIVIGLAIMVISLLT